MTRDNAPGEKAVVAQSTSNFFLKPKIPSTVGRFSVLRTMDFHNNSEQLETPLLPAESTSTMKVHEGEDDENHNQTTTGERPMTQPQDNSHQDNGNETNREPHVTSWYRNPHQITAMVSNFSTSYNVVNISLVLPILEQVYPKSSPEDEAASASSLLAGMILGQLIGGALGDSFLGRLGALKLVMALQVLASLASACIPGNVSDIYMWLAIWRFILGVGAGGVYPLAAVLSAEQGKPSRVAGNGGSADAVQRVVLTFSTQGLGFVTVPLMAVVFLHVTGRLDIIWRLLLGLGSVPGLTLMLLQWRLYAAKTSRREAIPLEEPPEDQANHDEAVEAPNNVSSSDTNDDLILSRNNEVGMDGIIRNNDNERGDTARRGLLASLRHEPGLGRKVLGTAGTWFLFDILFYGNTLFQPIVVEAAFGGAKSSSPIHLLQKTASDSLILTSIALPGYAVAGFLIGKKTCCITQTPRYVMLQGFAAMSILYLAIGSNWSYLRGYPALLVTLYGMTFFFANYGPNTTTFILPSLLYAPECRSTWNGISAASGKLGALLGATLFAPAAEEWGDSIVMMICAGVAIFAFLLTYFFVPKEEEREENMEAPGFEEPSVHRMESA